MILNDDYVFCLRCGKVVEPQKTWCENCFTSFYELPLKRVMHSAILYYLSGPMSGLPELNFPAFHAAAAKMRANGLWVLNPAELGETPGATRQDYYRRDIILMLRECTAIVMMPGWGISKGAILEHRVADDCGLKVYRLREDGLVAGPFGAQSPREPTIKFNTESQ